MPLNCTADGNPDPSITWTSPNGSKISFEPTFTLSITSKLDEGAYNCTADNGVGTPVTATVNIIVQRELASTGVIKTLLYLYYTWSKSEK